MNKRVAGKFELDGNSGWYDRVIKLNYLIRAFDDLVTFMIYAPFEIAIPNV